MRDSLPVRGVGPLLFALCALVLVGGHALHVALWPASQIPLPPPLLYALGGLLILFSLPIWVASAWGVLACQRRGVLMTAGVYRLCRHPMYGNGICLTLTGLCLFWRSWAMLPVPLICLGIARLLVIREERWLCATHGAAYARYRAQTPCLVPRLWRASIPFVAPLRTGPIAAATGEASGVIGINNLAASLFLIETVEGYVAVDAGTAARALARQLRRLQIDPARVTDVFITHADPDHTGGLDALPNARVHLGREELRLMELRAPRQIGRLRYEPLPRAAHALDEGDVLVIGGRTVRAIATPGHTPGSMAYLVDERLLFVGDALVLVSGQARQVLKPFIMDLPVHLASIRKLAAIEAVTLLCTAHGGCTDNLAQAFCGWR
jgi:glyoxylase-like metal-dependent hydrolase (beta-lactamase superfamily II)